MAGESADQALMEEVLRLDSFGLQLFPAKLYGTHPIFDWKQYQYKRTSPYLRTWFKQGKYNVWMLAGSMSGVVVLDMDSQEAEEWWRKIPGMADALDATTCVQTGSGKHHYWFSVEDGDDPVPNWNVHDDETGVNFDLRADNTTGVIIPPSLHHTTKLPYTWVRGLECLVPCPNALRRSDRPSRGDAGQGGVALSGARSMLASLLAKPPAVGGRNDWLSKIAGHLAKHIPYEDAYRAMLTMANDSLAQPLDEEELEKVTKSLWQTEQKRDRRAEPNESNGWLTSDGAKLLTPAKVNDNETLQVWADFDIRVTGIIADENERSYQVEVLRGDERHLSLLDPGTLGRPAELAVWLAGQGATILPPAGEMHKGSFSARLQRYLESQDAPTSTAVSHLGWNEGVKGFVTHEGIITATGMEPHGLLMPHPRLQNWGPYRYGFIDKTKAQETLAEVLTYQEPVITAVFGAWWAACFLKAQIMNETALFPFMAIEAPSESGKTAGFFAMMIQMGGNHEGHGEFTLPVLRDRASANRSGIVWVDDMSDSASVLDLVRQATSEGSRAKKGADRSAQETVQLVAPIAVSGEGLGALELEKALLDRAIKLEVSSPKDRPSQINLGTPQWDDIVAMKRKWDDDLTQMAGTFVQMALNKAGMVDDLRSLRVGSGRHADKIAILRLGARLLAELCGDDWVIGVVDQWCLDAPDIGNENVLTTQILPTLLRSFGIPGGAAGHVPTFVDKHGIVWMSEEGVADSWKVHCTNPRERQLGSLSSIRGQRRSMGATESRDFSVRDPSKRQEQDTTRLYYCLDATISASVMGRTGMKKVTKPSATQKLRDRTGPAKLRRPKQGTLLDREES